MQLNCAEMHLLEDILGADRFHIPCRKWVHHLNLRNREASAGVWDIFGFTIGCGSRCQGSPKNNGREVATTISSIRGNWLQMQCHLNQLSPSLPPNTQLLCWKTQGSV